MDRALCLNRDPRNEIWEFHDEAIADLCSIQAKQQEIDAAEMGRVNSDTKQASKESSATSDETSEKEKSTQEEENAEDDDEEETLVAWCW